MSCIQASPSPANSKAGGAEQVPGVHKLASHPLIIGEDGDTEDQEVREQRVCIRGAAG